MDKADADEQRRLDALKSYGILDTPPEADLDRLTRLAAHVCETPIAVITLIDEKRQWFKSAVGLDIRQTDRSVAICAHAIRGRSLFMVRDTLKVSVFADNPLVVDGSEIRFYAGMPLVTPSGFALGTLAVMDRVPRNLSDQKLEALVSLAEQVMAQIEVRRQRNQLEALAAERNRMNVSLRELSTHLEEAQQIAGVGSWVLQVPENRLTCSNEILRIFGISRDAFKGDFDGFIAQVHLDDRRKVAAEKDQAWAGGKPVDIECRILRPGGELRHVHLRAVLHTNAAKQPLSLSGTVLDITERKRAEQGLRKSEANLEASQTHAHLGSWELDLATLTGKWSPEMSRLHYRAPSLDAPSFAEFIEMVHPQDRPMVLEVQANAPNSTIPLAHEYRTNPSLGVVKHISATVYPVRDENGRAVLLLGTSLDISAHRQAAEVLKENSRRLGVMLEAQQAIATSKLDLPGVMALLCEKCRQLTSAEGAGIEMIDGDEMLYVAAAGSEALKGIGLRLKRDASLSGLAISQNHGLFCDDTETDPRVDVESSRKYGLRSLAVAVLRVDAMPIGVVKVLSARPATFSGRDVDALQLLSESLGALIQRRQAAERLQASEEQYRALFEQNPHPMWAYDPETLHFLAVNAAALERYGYSEAEFLAMTIRDLRPVEDVTVLRNAVASLPEHEKTKGLRRHRCKDGSIIDVDISHDTAVINGHTARLVIAQDVSERLRNRRDLARTNRALKLLSSCNEALIRSADEKTLLTNICRIAVEIGGYRMAWVGYAQDDESRSILPMAHAGAENGYLAQFELSWADDRAVGLGPAGLCIRGGRAIVREDITQDPGFVWQASAQQRGYRGVICLPLRSRDRSFGLLALYSAEVRVVSEGEIGLLQELSDNLAFGVGHLQAQREQERLQIAVLKVAAGVSTRTGGAFFEQLAASLAEAVSAPVALITRLLPGEPITARTVAAIVDGRKVTSGEYPVLAGFCANLLQTNTVVVPDCAAQHLPAAPEVAALGLRAYVGRRLDNAAGQPVGQIFVVFREPLKNATFVSSTLQIFAARAAAELERQDIDARIGEQASLLDKAQDAILVRDIDHHVLFWNKTAERYYGWLASEALGRSIVELIYDDPTDFLAASKIAMEAGEWRGQIRQRRKNGSGLTIEGHWTLVRDDEGRPKSILDINTDITKRLAMEEQLERSQRLESVGQLTGGVAHDFNNLLTVILGNSELLVEKLGDDEKLGMLATMIRTAAQRGAELTHRLLAFARRQALEPRAIDANQLLAGIDRLLRRTLSEDIEMEFIRAAGLWPALVDPSQLENALLNLCINARDAMKSGGLLTIETANVRLDQDYADQHTEVTPGQYVMVAVTDSGTGIAPEHLDRIFDPFFTTKPFGKGTGLGLSMVYGFVKQSRGHVKVYSEPGQGTSVKMYLPRSNRLDEPVGEAPVLGTTLRGTEKILLVEDDDLVRRHAEDQLIGLGYRLLVATNGPDALELIRKNADIDLLFTDVIMPGGMNGRELAEAARSLRPALRILYTSGYTENAIVHHGRLDWGVHLLNKPYQRLELARKVRAALSDP